MKSRGKIKLWIVLALLVACVAASVFILKLGGRTGEQPPVSTEDTAETAKEEAKDESPDAVIFAASDYQEDSHFEEPGDTLRGLIKAVRKDGKEPDAALFCGDYTNDAKLHDYQLSPEDSIDEIRKVVDEESSVGDEDTIFIQGNHDKLTESIAEDGLHEFDDYLIYVLNTEDDFPWKQGVTPGCLAKVTKSSEEMKECFDRLIRAGEKRPVIITGHVPLHYTARTSSRHTTGDNLYSSLIFDVVNSAAADLDIIYLFGHNHSKGWDCYLGGSSVYMAPGDTMLLPVYDESRVTTNEFTESTINFTYMNAGYTGYYMNCGPGEYSSDPDSQFRAADETLTCSVIEVYEDRIEITRYDKDGKHQLGAAGEADPYKGGIDDGLIGPEHYSKAVEGTAVIERTE